MVTKPKLLESKEEKLLRFHGRQKVLIQIMMAVRVEENRCWAWIATHYSSGYPRFVTFEPKFDVRAHRLMFAISHGKLDSKLVIDHVCKNKQCVNPAHIRQVTSYFNVIENSDSIQAKNKRKTRCKYGHKFSKTNTACYPMKNGNIGRYCKKCKKEDYLKKKRNKILPFGRTAV